MEFRRLHEFSKQVVVVVALLGIIVYQCSLRIQKVDESLRFAIGVSLVREYMGTGLKKQAQEYLNQRANANALTEPPPSSTPIPNVVLTSVTAHGSPDVVIAKVEITVNGGPPPDGHSVRYLKAERSRGGRWLVMEDTDASHYMLSLLLAPLPKSS